MSILKASEHAFADSGDLGGSDGGGGCRRRGRRGLSRASELPVARPRSGRRLRGAPPQPGPEQPKAQTVAPAPGPAATPPVPAAVKPAFDVVNVEPTGEAVVAGRAAPNATVELRDAGKTVAEATTDSAGEFVIIPPALAPGAHSLTLATGSGQSPAETSNAIPVAVPEPPPKEAVAAQPPPSPAATPPSPTAGGSAPAPAKVAVGSVEASAGGRLVAKGAADPNSTVRLYLSGAFVGDAKTKADGRWSLTIEHGMTPGAYEVRADQINPATAAVVARAEAPFEFPAAPQAAPATVVASADDKAAALRRLTGGCGDRFDSDASCRARPHALGHKPEILW